MLFEKLLCSHSMKNENMLSSWADRGETDWVTLECKCFSILCISWYSLWNQISWIDNLLHRRVSLVLNHRSDVRLVQKLLSFSGELILPMNFYFICNFAICWKFIWVKNLKESIIWKWVELLRKQRYLLNLLFISKSRIVGCMLFHPVIERFRSSVRWRKIVERLFFEARGSLTDLASTLEMNLSWREDWRSGFSLFILELICKVFLVVYKKCNLWEPRWFTPLDKVLGALLSFWVPWYSVRRTGGLLMNFLKLQLWEKFYWVENRTPNYDFFICFQ